MAGAKSKDFFKKPGRIFSILSLVCAVISFFYMPIIFVPIGVVCGIVAKRKGDSRLGNLGILLCVIFGAIRAYYVWNLLRHASSYGIGGLG